MKFRYALFQLKVGKYLHFVTWHFYFRMSRNLKAQILRNVTLSLLHSLVNTHLIGELFYFILFQLSFRSMFFYSGCQGTLPWMFSCFKHTCFRRIQFSKRLLISHHLKSGALKAFKRLKHAGQCALKHPCEV